MNIYKRLLPIMAVLTMISPAVYSDTPGYLSKSNSPQERGEGVTDERNLSDRDRWMTENYRHEGYMRRAYEEACLDQGDDIRQACQGIEVDNEFMGMDSTTIKGLSQMYGMIIGTGIGGDFTKKADSAGGDAGGGEGAGGDAGSADTAAAEGGGETAEGAGEEAGEDESVTDYCRYVAVGTETLGAANQMSGQDQINNTPMQEGNEHRESLYRAARAHDQRSDTAKIQGIGWGATTACYTYMVATTSPSAGGIAKLAASAVLTAFWWDEVEHHAKYGDMMRDLADGLPGAGDCNPVDDLQCYCAQPETKYDPEYCLPEDYHRIRKVADTDLVSSCIDDKLEDDPECRCRRTNSCYDEVVRHKLEGMNFGEGFSSADMGGFSKLMRGEVEGGRLSDGSLGRDQRAIARRALEQVEDNLDKVNPGNLTKEQREHARGLQEMGIPPRLAAKMASSPNMNRNNDAAKNFASSFTPRSGNRAVDQSSNNSRVLSFGGGRGLDGPSRRGSSRQSNDNPFKDFLNQGQEEDGMDNDRVMMFRGRAAASQSAQISNNKSHSVFDIISHRYRSSGWKRLELDP